MSPAAGSVLLQYGAIGVVLAVFLVLFVQTWRLVIRRLLSHFTAVEAAMKDMAGAIRDLLVEMRAGREDAVRELRQEIRENGNGHAHVRRRRKRTPSPQLPLTKARRRGA